MNHRLNELLKFCRSKDQQAKRIHRYLQTKDHAVSPDPGYYMEFTVRPEHIALIQAMYISGYHDVDAPCVDTRRPYGNSDVPGDIHEILVNEPIGEDGLNEIQIQMYERLHTESGVALQIIMVEMQFWPGHYRRTESYGTRSWVKTANLEDVQYCTCCGVFNPLCECGGGRM